MKKTAFFCKFQENRMKLKLCRHGGMLRLTLRFASVLFIIFAYLSCPPSWARQAVVMSDAELAEMTGQAGINIYTSIATRYTASVWKVSDTDSTPVNWLEFRNITIDDGNGGYFLIQTPSLDETMTLDVGTNDAGRTLVAFKDYRHASPRWYSVGEMVFCRLCIVSARMPTGREGDMILICRRAPTLKPSGTPTTQVPKH